MHFVRDPQRQSILVTAWFQAVENSDGGAAAQPPPPWSLIDYVFVSHFCIRMLQNKAHIARESIKTLRASRTLGPWTPAVRAVRVHELQHVTLDKIFQQSKQKLLPEYRPKIAPKSPIFCPNSIPWLGGGGGGHSASLPMSHTPGCF